MIGVYCVGCTDEDALLHPHAASHTGLGHKSRMKFSVVVTITLLLSAVQALYSIPARCNGKIRLRMEWRDLSKEQQDRFINALLRMKENGKYEQFVRDHDQYAASQMHRTDQFFVVHRMMLAEFENELIKIDSNVILPYWDASLDAHAPAFSNIWSAFGTGDADQCLRKSPFAKWTMNHPTPHCLRRGFSTGDIGLSKFSDSAPLGYIVRTAETYTNFRELIEYGIHNQLHQILGGNNGADFGQYFAANDMIFYLRKFFLRKDS